MSLRIAYLFSRFPVQTQTFAISDIQTLRNMGHKASVHGLLSWGSGTRNLVNLYGLNDMNITHATVKTLVSFLRVLVTRPTWAPRAFMYVCANLAGSPRHLISSLLALPRSLEILLELEQAKPTIIHAFWGHYPVLPLMLAQRILKLPVTMFLGAYDLYAGYPLTRNALWQSAAVFTHAYWNIPHIRNVAPVPEEKIHAVHRGIPVDDFADLDGIAKIKHRFSTVSALAASKKVDKVIETFAIIRKTLLDATLVVCGDGPERSKLEALAKSLEVDDAVIFTGYLKRHEVVRHMAQSEVFIFLSEKESDRLPNVVKEAMLTRSLCVVSPTNAIEELVTPQTGIVLPQAGPAHAAQTVLDTLADREKLQSMAEEARTHILQHFTATVAIQRYIDVWKRLAGS